VTSVIDVAFCAKAEKHRDARITDKKEIFLMVNELIWFMESNLQFKVSESKKLLYA
jgi:hypothetical protein